MNMFNKETPNTTQSSNGNPRRMKVETTFKTRSRQLVASLVFITGSLVAGCVSAKDIPGASPTSYSVSPSGAFQFQIPVTKPVGRNGMAPNLSIVFSSSAGNGSLGVGWNVAGLSAITRCPKTVASNGSYKGVSHSSSDRFCLGGSQLRLVSSGTYGGAGTEYRTEVEQFSIIEAVGSGSINLMDSGTAPTSWKVTAKDGLIYYYGQTSDSRLEITKSGTQKSTHRWSLNKVLDRSGNYYTVTYRTADGLPQKIDYTYHSGASAEQSIEYVYESRPDVRTNYLFGRQISQNVRLDRLDVKNKSQIFRQYKFAYEARPNGDLRPSRITSIEECGLNNACLPKLPVNWQPEQDGFSSTVSTNSSDVLPTYLTKFATVGGVDSELNYGALVDVNSDGLTDLVIAVIEPNGTFKAETHLKTPTGWQTSNAWKLPKPLRSYNNAYLNYAQFTQTQIDMGELVDVNGDGLVDLVYSYEHFTDATQANTRITETAVYLNSETGFSTTASTAYRPPVKTEAGSTGRRVLVDYTSNGDGYSVMRTQRARLVDVNGDGLVDWVTAYHSYLRGQIVRATHLNTGNGWAASVDAGYEFPDHFVEYIGTHPPLPHGDFMDVNGDGLIDWVQSNYYTNRPSGQQTQSITWLNSGTGWDPHTSVYTLPSVLYKKVTGASLAFRRGSFLDLNGDGLRDYVVSISEGSTHPGDKFAYFNKGKGWANATDFNPDFVHIDYTYANPGRGWPVNTRGSYVDVNRDGLVDYIEAYRPISSGGVSQPPVYNLWLNTGTTWTKRNDLHPNWLLYDYDGRGHDTHKTTVSQIFDINSDGSPDWVKVRQGEVATLTNRQSRPNQIESIETTLGVKVKPSFASLSAVNGLYTRTPTSSRPTSDPFSVAPNAYLFGTTMYVTNQLSVSRADDVNAFNISTYKYEGAQVDRTGRGFLGFYRFETTSPKGIKNATEFYQEWPLTGMSKRSLTTHGGEVLADQISQYSYTTIDASNASRKRVYVKLDSTSSKNYELDNQGMVKEQLRSLQYDAHGNITVDSTETKSGNGTSLGTTTITNTYRGYGTSGTLAPIGLVDDTTTVFTKAGESTITNYVDFEYYQNGLLYRAKREPNANDARVKSITEYNYDAYGNVDLEKVMGYVGDPDTRITDYDYGSNHRLPEFVTNAAGHQGQITYHATCDLPTTQTDANAQATTITYNNFCVQESVTTPDNLIKTTSYQWGSNVPSCSATAGCASPPALYVTVTATGQAPVNTFFNHALQPLLVVTEGMDFAQIHQTTSYDRYGRTATQSQPFFSVDSPINQVFHYDELDRPTRIDLPFDTYPTDENNPATAQDAYTSLTYGVDQNGNAMTVERDAEGFTKTTHLNALGQTVSVVDANNNAMLYRFDARGNLKETEDSAGNIISVDYDLIGRRIGLDDPDLGVSTYEHSVFGEIVEQSDAEDLIIYSQYDKLGRLVERKVPVSNTDPTQQPDPSQWVYDVSTWVYDQGTNRKGLLNSVTTVVNHGESNQATSYQKVFGYDSLNRLDTETTTVKGKTFVQTFGYNANGQLSLRQFPSSGGTEAMQINLNYTNGYLSSITDKPLNASNCLEHWRAIRYDALGRLREESLGAFITSERVYNDAQGTLLEAQAKTNILGVEKQVQNLSYRYDATNNLRSREDNLTGLLEGFAYDSLHRLTEHKRNGVVETTVMYDAIGNITYKSDVGTYNYSNVNVGPHALTSVSLPLAVSADLNQFGVQWEFDGENLIKSLPTIHGQTFTYDKRGNVLRSGNRAVYWTAFSKPRLMIAEKANGMQHGSVIEYDADFNRMYKQEGTYTGLATLDTVKEQTYYVGKDYELVESSDGSITHRYHITAGSHRVQIERAQGESVDDTKYLLNDNLGSTNVIIDTKGDLVQRLEFDPWGMRTTASPLLNGETPQTDVTNEVTNVGYTGHEMDDEVGLINMNARIYDPYLGRFLSADPVLPDPGDMQAFNRYAYVLGNPLKYTDPTGHRAHRTTITFGIFEGQTELGIGIGRSGIYYIDDIGNFRDLAPFDISLDGTVIDVICDAVGAACGRAAEGDDRGERSGRSVDINPSGVTITYDGPGGERVFTANLGINYQRVFDSESQPVDPRGAIFLIGIDEGSSGFVNASNRTDRSGPTFEILPVISERNSDAIRRDLPGVRNFILSSVQYKHIIDRHAFEGPKYGGEAGSFSEQFLSREAGTTQGQFQKRLALVLLLSDYVGLVREREGTRLMFRVPKHIDIGTDYFGRAPVRASVISIIIRPLQNGNYNIVSVYPHVPI